MIIDVDIGNTRVKWRSSAEPERLLAHATIAEAEASWSVLRGVTRMRVAAVVNPQKMEMLSRWCRAVLGIAPEVAEIDGELAGVRVGYRDPGSLGVDRWLAMLAAVQQCGLQDLVVVSAGTAVTVDYVDAAGRHRGGYIMPGWRLAADALLGGTDGVRCVDPQVPNDVLPGDSTQSCVEGGLGLLYRGAIESALQPDLDNFEAATLIVTGGDGQLLAGLQRTRVRCSYDPLLVLRGLAIALP